ncbi:hypothetical protein ACJX0J_030524 [Zea mays]
MDGVVTLHETIHEMHMTRQGDPLSPILFNIVVDMLAVGVISEKTNSLSIFMLSFFETDQMELINEDGVNKTITQAQYMPGDSQFWSIHITIYIFMWYLIKNIKTLERDISSWIVLLLDAFGEGIQHMFGNWLNGVDDTLNGDLNIVDMLVLGCLSGLAKVLVDLHPFYYRDYIWLKSKETFCFIVLLKTNKYYNNTKITMFLRYSETFSTRRENLLHQDNHNDMFYGDSSEDVLDFKTLHTRKPAEVLLLLIIRLSLNFGAIYLHEAHLFHLNNFLHVHPLHRYH